MYSFKNNDNLVFMDGKKYNATPGLWDLLTKSIPDRNLVSVRNKQAYKQVLLLSNANRVNYCPSGNVEGNKRPLGIIEANRGLKYTLFISQPFTNTKEVPLESLEQ